VTLAWLKAYILSLMMHGVCVLIFKFASTINLLIFSGTIFKFIGSKIWPWLQSCVSRGNVSYADEHVKDFIIYVKNAENTPDIIVSFIFVLFKGIVLELCLLIVLGSLYCSCSCFPNLDCCRLLLFVFY